MRILLINPNTNADVTQHIKDEAKRWAGRDTNIDATNAHFGPDIVSSRTEAAIAQHGLLDACARYGGNADAIIAAMSLDSGVWAARQMMDVPVLGISEAALHMASLHGNAIGMIVFGHSVQPYREMAAAYGYGSRLGHAEALGIAPQAHLDDPERTAKLITERAFALAQEERIDCLMLAGAVAAGLPEMLRGDMPIPVFEGISSAVLLAETMVKLRAKPPSLGSFARPAGRMSDGLGDALSDRLRLR